MKTLRLPLIFVLVTAWPAGLRAGLEESVALSATARPEYVRATDASGKPNPESYVFSPGHYFPGGTKDGSLERMTFMDLAQTLAPDLARQNYFPTRDAAAADLTIIVHWGTTTTYEDPMKTFNTADQNKALAEFNTNIAQYGIADPMPLNAVLDQQAMAQDSAMGAVNYNAVLLGYARNLKKERAHAMPTAEEWTLSMELNEERYFVVLMAYDNQFARKEHKAKLLWVTRLSIRAPGNNFTESLPALSQVGGQIFGRQLDGLAHVKTSWKSGKVTLGEMKVLSMEPPAPPAKTDK
jgi:hypothetical protein